MNHRGALLRRSVLNMEPVGPSPWTNPNTGDAVRPLTVPEIAEIQKLFVASARRLEQAGYDGVEVHAGNGYLFQQFFTPRINKRTDAYGGSFDNRARLLLETIARVKDALPDFPLVVRLSRERIHRRRLHAGGHRRACAGGSKRAGVVALDISGGTQRKPAAFQVLHPAAVVSARLSRAVFEADQGGGVDSGVRRRAGSSIRKTPKRCCASGSADFVSVGRALYTDPHWCLKAFGKLDAPIRKCIACNVCFERLTLEKDVACVHNPMIGTEFEALEYAEPQLVPDAQARDPRRVLVLGAGVSGIEAARVLAARGHAVEVWEKTARARRADLRSRSPRPTSAKWSRYGRIAGRKCSRSNVPVRTGVAVTAEAIRAFAPDFVIVATGAHPRPCPFDTSRLELRSPSCMHGTSSSRPERVAAGSAATIIGGGMVGMETADLLSARGVRCTVVEALASVAPGMARNNRMELIERVVARGTRIMTGASVIGAQGTSLELSGADGDDDVARDRRFPDHCDRARVGSGGEPPV